MDEEDEDCLDIFADETDPLLSSVLDECLMDKPEQKSDKQPTANETADETTALAELPDYKPIVKDKDLGMDDKTYPEDDLAAVHAANNGGITEPLSGEQKINSTLSEIISDNRKRENRKRPFNPSMAGTYSMHAFGRKQRYGTKNGIQLCLQPRKDIAELSGQEAGAELARCLDEVSSNLLL